MSSSFLISVLALLNAFILFGCDSSNTENETPKKIDSSQESTISSEKEPDYASIRPNTEWVDPNRGCQNLLVYRFNEPQSEALVISASRTLLGLSTEKTVFNLSETYQIQTLNQDDTTNRTLASTTDTLTETETNTDSDTDLEVDPPEEPLVNMESIDKEALKELKISIDVYSQPSDEFSEFPYCNDTASFTERPTSWVALRGEVSIQLSKNVEHALEEYQATIEFDHVVFYDPNGQNPVVLESLRLEDVRVGGF